MKTLITNQQKIKYLIATYTLIIFLILLPLHSVLANSENPRTTPHLPRVPGSTLVSQSKAEECPSLLDLAPLKAVLIVGPIDGDDGPETNSNKVDMDKAADELVKNGVTVYKFYAPNNDWNEIKNAAIGANFLMYRGHGVYWSPMPTPIVGGFTLSTTFVSNDMIRNELQLAPNAIVMLYACFSAGSAGNDTISLTSTEAQRRVAMYSDPFLDIGVAGYYADWFGDAFQMYVRYLFEGKTLKETYESFYDFHSNTVERYTHPDHPDKVMWLDKDYWYDPLPQYNDAFVGMPDKTITDLFPPLPQSEMNVSSLDVNRFVQLGETPQPISINISISSSDPNTLTGWHVVIDEQPGWLSFSQMSGENGQNLLLTFEPSPLGEYQGQFMIVADDPSIINREQVVTIHYYVFETVFNSFIPIVSNATE